MGIIRAHEISAGTEFRARVTDTHASPVEIPSTSATVTGNVLRLVDIGLSTEATTQNAFFVQVSEQRRVLGMVDLVLETAVWTYTTFGAADGAGTGNGVLFTDATNLQLVNVAGEVGLNITFGTNAQAISAIAGLQVFQINIQWEVSPQINAAFGTETTLDAGEGGFVQQVLVAGTGALSTNAQERQLIYIIGRDAAAPNTPVDTEIRQIVRPGAAVPGDAVIESTNNDILFVIINS